MKHIQTEKRYRVWYLLLSVALFSFAVTYIDACVHPPYFSKIPIKILFFAALPMLYFAVFQEERPLLAALFRFRKRGLAAAAGIGLGIFAVILGGYFALRPVVDFSGVTASLTSGMGITRDNFIWVALYVSILNSFLEEFFFRGFGFLTLKNKVCAGFAWIYSPVLFALYHAGMLWDMFSPAVLVLLLAGLIAGGLIFNALNDRFGSLYPSWFAHMGANFAINTIGFLLFAAEA